MASASKPNIFFPSQSYSFPTFQKVAKLLQCDDCTGCELYEKAKH